MNELLGWYGYCNNNEHSNNQANFMTMHTAKMPKHAISQASMLTTETSADNGHALHPTGSAFDDFDTHMDSRSSTDDSMKMSPNFIVAKRPLHSSSTQEKPQSGEWWTQSPCAVEHAKCSVFRARAPAPDDKTPQFRRKQRK